MYKNKNTIELVEAINKVTTTHTRKTLINFLNGEPMILNDEEGLIISMFIGFWQKSNMTNDEMVINQFINYAFYRKKRDYKKCLRQPVSPPRINDKTSVIDKEVD